MTERGTFNYRNYPTLRTYIERVGAEELNFRRFMVKKWHGIYYQERMVINIAEDGTIRVRGDDASEYAPTKDEAAKIKEEMATAKFPKSANATAAQVRALRTSGLIYGTLYEFYDAARTGIIMCQERRETETGKIYLPWTYFDDGEWRMMEPTGKLPLWKPKKPTDLPRLMVHEGAKTAEVVSRMIAEKKPHPWYEKLAEYEHWGMIGGAMALHRADYDELRKFKPIEMVYVADNDQHGKDGVMVVSELYGGSMTQVKFDDRFPAGWDMADPMPEDMRFANGRYSGPTLDKFISRATWATERVPIDGSKKIVYKIRRSFASEWLHSTKPEVFIHRRWTNDMWDRNQFNSWIKGFTNVKDTAELMLAEEACKSATVKYDPSKKPGVFADKSEKGRLYINVFNPPSVVEEEGDPAPFLEFFEQLVEDEGDRRELLRWCATLAIRPEVKMMYGVLMISESQGVGKSTLSTILTKLVGKENVSTPGEDDIVNSQFNSWASNKRLAIINEIYQGHSSAAYNKLKDKITDPTITVKEKYQHHYVIDNYLHILACSNDKRALRMTSDDRRWLVPMITEKKRSIEYWTKFNSWLDEENGIGIVRWYMRNWLKDNKPVSRGADAPWSNAKLEVIEEGYSQGQKIVSEYLDEARRRLNGKPAIVTDTALLEMVKHFVYQGRPTDRMYERPVHMRKVAKTSGWYVSDHYVFCREMGIAKNSRVISTEREPTTYGADLLRDRAKDLWELEPIPDCGAWKIFTSTM